METAIATSCKMPGALSEDAKSRLRVRQLDQILSHSAIAAVLATVFAAVIAAFFAPPSAWVWPRRGSSPRPLSAAPRVLVAIGYKQDRLREMVRSRPWVLHATILLDGAIWGLPGWQRRGRRQMRRRRSSPASRWSPRSRRSACRCNCSRPRSSSRRSSRLTVVGLLLRFDSLGVFASIGLGLLIIQLWVSAFSTEKRLAREFLSREQLSHALQLQSETAERLEKTTEQLRREGAVKSMFLGTMSHELRTPLHGILGITAMMQRETQDPISLSRLGIVQAQGEHLLGLIGALLDVSRIETGRLELHPAPFDLAVELRQLADLYRERTAGTAVSFVLDAQTARHLLGLGRRRPGAPGAAQPSGQRRQVHQAGLDQARRTRGAHGETVFTVTDTGPGSPPRIRSGSSRPFAQTASVGDAAGCRNGPRPGHLARAGAGDGRRGDGRKRRRRRIEVPVHGVAAGSRRARRRRATHALRRQLGPRRTRSRGYRVLLAEDNDVNALIAEAVLQQLRRRGPSGRRSGRDAVAAATGDATAPRRPHGPAHARPRWSGRHAGDPGRGRPRRGSLECRSSP